MLHTALILDHMHVTQQNMFALGSTVSCCILYQAPSGGNYYYYVKTLYYRCRASAFLSKMAFIVKKLTQQLFTYNWRKKRKKFLQMLTFCDIQIEEIAV